ncbi:alpha-mannosidase [Alkalicoccobacillus porphyridii]|uniref:Alpha-mannosidase n=1 Tax=Alkalicoccobacillus porphyridii TaxID=2597270 RepID=A0A553ZX61_9BACI|nr:alpha-mannosidase [Alkalicoccobacillus porphyridii]TSB46024.1 alpha-mannosidase [Alkalicoccobacillus porphyridii]
MQRIRRCLNELGALIYKDSVDVTGWMATRAFYQSPGSYERKDSEPFPIHVGDHLINSSETMFIENELTIPESFVNESIGLEFKVGQHGIKTNHEGLVYVDGVPYHGVDRNRSFVPLPDATSGKRTYQIKIELFNPAAQVVDQLNYQNEPAEFAPAPLYLLESKCIRPNKALESLYYSMKVYLEAAVLLPEEDMKRMKIVKELTQLKNWIINTSQEDLLQDATLVKEKEAAFIHSLSELDQNERGYIHMVGQSHIDLAWLWPMKEAVRKTSRTFSTMSTLLDQYEGFQYAQSQPQAYDYVKTHYPELYKRVKQHIQDGRWEIVGGMWVEPDLNIPSGESLVRQLLYGMKFFKEEFDVQPRIEWLPDTFGYCASLPQLLKKAGLDYFMTTKMNWNDTNPFPHDLFHWVGIDGTSVLSYLNHGVNEYTHPKEIKEHWDSYKQKAVHPEQMLLYGHGDGGGGVTKEMIEYVERSSSLPGLPTNSYSTAHQFFDRITEAEPDLPSWVGDLYLELHRGTYTTHARNKRWNRQAEVLYRDAEVWTSFTNAFTQANVQADLEEGWKKLLFNQFHDIIPGTSIPEVYVISEEEYKQLLALGEGIKQEAIQTLSQEIHTEGNGNPLVLFNSLSWERSEVVTVKGGSDLLDVVVYNEQDQLLKSDVQVLAEDEIILTIHVPAIPQMGYCTVWLRPKPTSSENHEEANFHRTWETNYYSVEWNEHGEISRLFDKKANREVLRETETANQFQLFHDQPTYWDAWDIDPQFAEQALAKPQLISSEVILKGQTKDQLRFTWQVSHSKIEQDVIFYHHSKRIDFETKVSWHETHKLLKVAFPVDIQASKATFEIPFGAIERATHSNTSWEKAQFEVCGHRFADLSEGTYGVSLLNDCKYGYDVKGNTLRLSLLRAPTWPDPNADQGDHVFTYSLLPHEGTWIQANVTRQGYQLNYPVTSVLTTSHTGSLPSQQSFVQVHAKHAVLDTVKPSEDGEGVVFRLYESSGGRESIEINLNQSLTSAYETNLLEEQTSALITKDKTISTKVTPFEVKTIKIHE